MDHRPHGYLVSSNEGADKLTVPYIIVAKPFCGIGIERRTQFERTYVERRNDFGSSLGLVPLGGIVDLNLRKIGLTEELKAQKGAQ